MSAIDYTKSLQPNNPIVDADVKIVPHNINVKARIKEKANNNLSGSRYKYT